jgi:hypothetical protein
MNMRLRGVIIGSIAGAYNGYGINGTGLLGASW